MRDKILAENGKEYWRSVEEFVDAPEFEEFVKREYPHEIEEWDDVFSRRNFVKVMGASLALAGLSAAASSSRLKRSFRTSRRRKTCCRASRYFFATAMSLGGVATGLAGQIV